MINDINPISLSRRNVVKKGWNLKTVKAHEGNVRFVQEAAALENGSLNVSVHRGQRVKLIHEVRNVWSSGTSRRKPYMSIQNQVGSKDWFKTGVMISAGHLTSVVEDRLKQWSPADVGKDTIWAEVLWWRRSWRTSWGKSPWPCHSHHQLWTSLRRTNQMCKCPLRCWQKKV